MSFIYPIDILPCIFYKKQIDISQLLNFNYSCSVGRRINVETKISPEDLFETTLNGGKRIKSEYFPISQLINLSTNLLNKKFPLYYYSFRQINEGKDDWDGCSSPLSYLSLNNIEYLRTSFYVIKWCIIDIQNHTIPYIKENPKNINLKNTEKERTTKDHNNLIMALGNSKISNEKAIIYVNHSPNNLNYWHFTIDTYKDLTTEKPMQKFQGAWGRLIRDTLYNYLCTKTEIADDKSYVPINQYEELVLKKLIK